MKGIGEEVKVVIPRREGEAISCQPRNRECVTVIKAISGAGELLPAFVIFEGKKVQDQWVNLKMDERMKIAVSEKGWTDSELGLEWLKHFEEHTRAMVGKHRLLIMDGHASHASEQFEKMDRIILKFGGMCMTPRRGKEVKFLREVFDEKNARLLLNESQTEGLVIKMREGRRKRAGKGAAREARMLKTALIVKNGLKKEEVLKGKEDAKKVREKARITQAE